MTMAVMTLAAGRLVKPIVKPTTSSSRLMPTPSPTMERPRDPPSARAFSGAADQVKRRGRCGHPDQRHPGLECDQQDDGTPAE
jgi:hypothetical protein